MQFFCGNPKIPPPLRVVMPHFPPPLRVVMPHFPPPLRRGIKGVGKIIKNSCHCEIYAPFCHCKALKKPKQSTNFCHCENLRFCKKSRFVAIHTKSIIANPCNSKAKQSIYDFCGFIFGLP